MPRFATHPKRLQSLLKRQQQAKAVELLGGGSAPRSTPTTRGSARARAATSSPMSRGTCSAAPTRRHLSGPPRRGRGGSRSGRR